MAETVMVDIGLHLEDDPPRVSILIDASLYGLPSTLEAIGTPEWRQEALDAIQAGIVAKDLGIKHTSRTIETRLNLDNGSP